MAVSRIFKKNRPDRREASAVEFACVAPIFFMLVLGIIEFGRMMSVQEIRIDAAREGGRVAVVAGSTDTDVQTAITNHLSAAGISANSWSVSPDLSTNPGTGTAITVNVSVPCSNVSWTGFMNWFSGKSLSAKVVTTHE
jgi:Flp pilus assembly protein TadG